MTQWTEQLDQKVKSEDKAQAWPRAPECEVLYTPEMAGSGQRGICVQCGLLPSGGGHDGCLGTLPENIVMNACCGHGAESGAYVQYWDGSCIRGKEAIEEQYRLKHEPIDPSPELGKACLESIELSAHNGEGEG